MCDGIHAKCSGAEPGPLVSASYITSGAFTKHELVTWRYRGVALQTSTNNVDCAPIDGFAKGSCGVRCVVGRERADIPRIRSRGRLRHAMSRIADSSA
jgi:hypothetical protein